MQIVCVLCGFDSPQYALKGLTFYTAYGVGDWECAQVFGEELPTSSEGSGVRVVLGARLEADGRLSHWGYWTDPGIVCECDLASDARLVLGDSQNIRARYREPAMIADVGGSIALRIDNEVTVACFERTLSDLHQLGYTKIFVLVDGNRFICL